ncbi:peptidoglycan DD-metalloendopeptidase family protein [Janibacter sp. GS2]|uniref:M23 family metallopeptidase n=1 Tax=Janibacter sp. GS2 TaxID=3442646 RepID=UPI003EBA9B39
MTEYSGRHRPPTRAERRALQRRSSLPKSLTPAYALPTAAAVTLVLSAAGATAAQSSPFPGTASTQAAQTAFTAPGTAPAADDSGAVALLDDPELAETARTEAAVTSRDSSGLAERRQEVSATVAKDQGRDQERQRAARSEARAELAAKKKADKKAETTKAAEQERSSGAPAGDATTTDEASTATGWVKPLDNAVFTSPFGHRWGRLHAGQDYAASVGTPLKSMGAGTVVGAGPMSGYGIYIDIEYSDGTVSRYGHLSSVSATVGQQVAPGDVVALTGNTGRSTGPHLHMEIRPGGGEPIDPAGWLAERGIS